MHKYRKNFSPAVLVAFLLLFPLISFSQESNLRSYELVIENGRIYDGSGGAPYSARIVIDGDSIVKIEKDPLGEISAQRKIDAAGYIITPGFIDTHSHGDALETPQFQNFLAMGVTTISLGQDGFSPQQSDLVSYFHKVDAVQPGVNIAYFAGHNTLRTISGINYDSVPSTGDMHRLEELLKDALDAGAYGMTTGLEYSPGNFSQPDELQRLAEIVGSNEGIIMSHMRNEDDDKVESSIRELLEQGEHCPVHISHIKMVYGKGRERAEDLLNLLDSARAAGIKVSGDIYPYTASHTGIAILFPDWAKKPNDFQKVVSENREELEDFLRKKVAQRNGPEATLIGTGKFKGKTLADISEELDKSFEDVLIEEIGPYGADAAHFIMDEELQETLLQHEHINVCTDGSPTMHHPRSFGSFSKVIESYVLEKKLFPLEEAIYKMTGLAAANTQIKKRGVLKEGNKADILLFRPEEVKAKANYEEPQQLSAGMGYVIVNGKIALDPSGFTTERAGKVLRKGMD